MSSNGPSGAMPEPSVSDTPSFGAVTLVLLAIGLSAAGAKSRVGSRACHLADSLKGARTLGRFPVNGVDLRSTERLGSTPRPEHEKIKHLAPQHGHRHVSQGTDRNRNVPRQPEGIFEHHDGYRRADH